MSKKILTISIISIIILALIGGGAVWYLKTQKQEFTPSDDLGTVNPAVTENEDRQSAIENQKSEIINTDDWLTYRNEEYGFELRYPEKWIIQEREDIYLGEIENFIMLSPNNNNGHNFMFIYNIDVNNQQRCADESNIQQISIDGYPTYSAVIRSNPNLYINDQMLNTYSYCVQVKKNHLNIVFTPSLPQDKYQIKKEQYIAIIESLNFIE